MPKPDSAKPDGLKPNSPERGVTNESASQVSPDNKNEVIKATSPPGNIKNEVTKATEQAQDKDKEDKDTSPVGTISTNPAITVDVSSDIKKKAEQLQNDEVKNTGSEELTKSQNLMLDHAVKIENPEATAAAVNENAIILENEKSKVKKNKSENSNRAVINSLANEKDKKENDKKDKDNKNEGSKNAGEVTEPTPPTVTPPLVNETLPPNAEIIEDTTGGNGSTGTTNPEDIIVLPTNDTSTQGVSSNPIMETGIINSDDLLVNPTGFENGSAAAINSDISSMDVQTSSTTDSSVNAAAPLKNNEISIKSTIKTCPPAHAQPIEITNDLICEKTLFNKMKECDCPKKPVAQ